MTKEEKLKHLAAEMKKAEEEENEVYLKYLMRIKELTINVNAGAILIMQSGSPPPLPPYK